MKYPEKKNTKQRQQTNRKTELKKKKKKQQQQITHLHTITGKLFFLACFIFPNGLNKREESCLQ